MPIDKQIKSNCTNFCEVCRHGVVNMEKHVMTDIHKRWVKRLGQEMVITKPGVDYQRRQQIRRR